MVPVGLTKFRKGLYPLELFNKEDACAGAGSDPWLAAKDVWRNMASTLSMLLMNGIFWQERELPQEDTYDGYLQLENGVGMLRLLGTEVQDTLAELAWR